MTNTISMTNTFTSKDLLRGEFNNVNFICKDINALVAPFVAIATKTPMTLFQNGIALEQIFTNTELLTHDDFMNFSKLPAGTFLVTGDYITLNPYNTEQDTQSIFVLRFFVHATRDLFLILFFTLTFSSFMLFISKKRHILGNYFSYFSIFTIGCSILGALLISCNILGLFLPLRSAELKPRSKEISRLSYGPGDIVLDLKETKKQILRMPNESTEHFSHRLTYVVADSLAHIWQYNARHRFHLKIPLQENYILWFAGNIHPSYRKYFFSDPRRALERGVAICSQAASVLVALLREK